MPRSLPRECQEVFTSYPGRFLGWGKRDSLSIFAPLLLFPHTPPPTSPWSRPLVLVPLLLWLPVASSHTCLHKIIPISHALQAPFYNSRLCRGKPDSAVPCIRLM